ncbi:DUF4238 domain-containing protein [Algoriphagus marincola]|uniref:DUF4238 domain-containing protein n=1 Tax=Algoriphagus marincola TaxID=264027 RepID=A0ABS7N531_9BACT|nr:DUF4238 domain-containing protein [Algoriphagus marincola]MBY5951446.1 DUF4238 domain-containing protein [Algoriphagus marincola]
MSDPKKHHYVPECYLNEYSGGQDLYCLDLPLLLERNKVSVKCKNPSQLCYLIDFYSINNVNFFDLMNYNVYHIETISFKKVENNYRKIITFLLQDFKLNSDQCIQLSDFILQIKIRNPFFLKVSEYNKVKNLDNVKSDLLIRVLNEERFKNIPKEIVSEMIELFGKRLSESKSFIRDMQLKQLIEKSNPSSKSIVKFRESMLDCKWYLLDSKTCKSSFFTSDNPGISISDNGVLENTKFAQGFRFYFPISSRFCLFFSDHYRDDFYKNGIDGKKSIEILQIEEVQLDYINTLFTPYHNKYLFSRNKEDLIYFGNKLLNTPV